MLSILSKHKILWSKFEAKLEHLKQLLVSVVIISIFMLAYQALQRPVTPTQYQQVVQFSQQASHPKTQYMAKQILAHPDIHRGDYLKLLNAYQFESKRIKQYPAMAKEDE